MMTIMVTGASGLIGSHLCRELSQRDYTIVALSRTVSPTLRSAAHEYPRNLILEYCDIGDYHALSELMHNYKPTTVFHLAACCLPIHNNNDFIQSNIKGTANIVGALSGSSVEQLIYASTMSVYSAPPVSLPVDELHPTVPANMYGRTKLAGEYMCRCLSNDLTVSILRFASVFGVGDNTRVAGLFSSAALSGSPLKVQGDGSQSSDFIYVDNAVQGLILAWEKKLPGVFNIGSGKETTIMELARSFIQAMDSRSDIELSGNSNRPFRFVSDITKARTELGYNPMPIKDGIKKYMEELRG